MAVDKNTEQLAADAVALAQNMLVLYYDAKHIYQAYFDREINTDVNALASGAQVGASPFDKETFVSTIAAIEQFLNFLDGNAVAASAYRISFNKASALD